MWDAHDRKIQLPLRPNGNYSFEVHWGDGAKETITSSDCKHTYAKPGHYTVSIVGVIDGFAFADLDGSNARPDRDKLLDVKQWGCVKVGPAMFRGCSKMTASATDAPDLTEVQRGPRLCCLPTCSSRVLLRWRT